MRPPTRRSESGSELVVRRPSTLILEHSISSDAASSRGSSPVRAALRPGSSGGESPVRAFYLQRSESSSTSVLGLR